MPFESEAQRKWMYANYPEMAKEWEAHTSKEKKLPKRKRKKRRRRRRNKSMLLALWANDVQRRCLMEAGDDVDAGLTAAEIILSTETMPADFFIPLDIEGDSKKPKSQKQPEKSRIELIAEILVALHGDRAEKIADKIGPAVYRAMAEAEKSNPEGGAAFAFVGQVRYGSVSPGKHWKAAPSGSRGGIKWVYMGKPTTATPAPSGHQAAPAAGTGAATVPTPAQPTAQPAPAAPPPAPVPSPTPALPPAPPPPQPAPVTPTIPAVGQTRFLNPLNAHGVFNESMSILNSGGRLTNHEALILSGHLPVLKRDELKELALKLTGVKVSFTKSQLHQRVITALQAHTGMAIAQPSPAAPVPITTPTPASAMSPMAPTPAPAAPATPTPAGWGSTAAPGAPAVPSTWGVRLASAHNRAINEALTAINSGQSITSQRFLFIQSALNNMSVPELQALRNHIGLPVTSTTNSQLRNYFRASTIGATPPTATPTPTPAPIPTPTVSTPAVPAYTGPDEISWNTGVAQPGSINGVDFKPAPHHFWEQVKDVDINAPAPVSPVQRVGVLIQEPDGRIWIVKPTNHFGRRQHTLPGGGVEPGLTDQQNALKEVWEETGLQVEITGHLGDFEDSNNSNNGRLYIGKRVGGQPWDAKVEDGSQGQRPIKYEQGKGTHDPSKDGQFAAESEKIKLVTLDQAAKLLHRSDDLAQLMTVRPIDVGTPTSGKGSEPLKKLVAALQPKAKAWAALQASHGITYNPGNGELHAVQEMRGFNAKPQVVSKTDMDSLVSQGTHIEVLRGIKPAGNRSADELAEDFKTGTHFPGHGVFGSGTYTDPTSGHSNVADRYAYSSSGTGNVLRIAIPKTAKIIKVSELERLVPKEPEAFKGYQSVGGKQARKCWLGVQAALAGYDVIENDKRASWGSWDNKYLIILNRSIVAVQKENAQGHQII